MTRSRIGRVGPLSRIRCPTSLTALPRMSLMTACQISSLTSVVAQITGWHTDGFLDVVSAIGGS